MLVAIQTAAGLRARYGSARRAVSSPASRRTVTATATTAEQPTATTSTAAQTGPGSPTLARAQSTSTGSGGCPRTWGIAGEPLGEGGQPAQRVVPDGGQHGAGTRTGW